MKQFLLKSSDSIIQLFFCFFILCYGILNLVFVVYQVNNDQLVINHYHMNINPISVVQTILLLFVLFMVYKHLKISSKKLLFVFLSLGFILSLYWVFSNHQELLELDDAYNTYHAAVKMANGDYSPLNFKSYLNMYPHNLGMLSYFMIHIKLFQSHALSSLRFTNILFSLLGYYSLYQISFLLFKHEKVQKLLVCLLFCSFQLFFYNFYIYANVVSYASALFSVYMLLLYFDKHKILYITLSILSIVFASITKNNSLIILLAEIIFIVLHIIQTKRVQLILAILVLIAGQYFASTGIIRFYEKRIQYPFSHNSLPRIVWIATGLNYDKDHPGGYNGIIETFHYENNFDRNYTELEAKRYMNHALSRLKNPQHFFSFFTNKLAVSYANNEYDAFGQFRALPQSEINKNIISGPINWMLKYYFDIAANCISIGLLYLFFQIKKITNTQLLPACIVVGGFLFHLIWEVKAIYLYQYFLYLLPYAAYGLHLLFSKNKSLLLQQS